jgi:hypothetical protein
MNYIWSEEKSQFHVGSKINTDFSCEAFSEKLALNPGVLKKIFFR